MPLLPRLTLWICALGYLGFGFACLVAPRELLALGGLEMRGPGAAAELRAIYGGLEIALGGWLLAAVRQPAWHRPALWLAFASFLGLGAARALGMALDQVATPFLVLALATEIALAVLAAVALRRPS